MSEEVTAVETVVEAANVEASGASELDIAAVSDQLGADLFPSSEKVESEIKEPEAKPTPEKSEEKPPAAEVKSEEPSSESIANKIPPPKTWRKEALADWDALTPTVQAEVLKREEDMFRGLESYKVDANIGRTLQSILMPHKHLLEQSGANPLNLVSGLMNAHVALSTGTPEQKMAMLQNMIQHYGLDPNNAPYIDPQTNELQNKINLLESKLMKFEGSQREQTVQAHRQTVEAFAADPKNIYFDEVATDIAQLIKSGVAKDLADAYEKAVWANPATRAKETARLQTESAAKAEEEAKKRSEEAKAAAAANVKSSPKRGRQTEPTGTIDETLEETMAKIKNRNKH